jgi:WD40 repeat protein
MGKAVMELTQRIKQEQEASSGKGGASSSSLEPKSPAPVPSPKITREQLEAEEETVRTQRAILSKSTGGGYGYDRDAAAPIAQWGVPDTLVVNKENNPNTAAATKGGRQRWVAGRMGEREAKSYLDAFVALQLWILSLPDDSVGVTGWQPKTTNVIAKARALIAANANDNENDSGRSETDGTEAKENKEGESKKEEPEATIVGKSEDADKKEGDDAIKTKEDEKDADNGNKSKESEGDDTSDEKMQQKSNVLSTVLSELSKATSTAGDQSSSVSAVYPIPPSAKAELLSVSFALLVHTYCELLEVGMESTAHVLRDAFRPIYDPLPSGYGTQYKDLYQCVTTEDMVKLNTHNSQHMDALANLKTTLVQVASIQMKKKEMENAMAAAASSGANVDPNTQQARQKKLQEYDTTIGLLKQKHSELSQRATTAYDRMYDLPFLRRARAVRWQLTLSTTSYGMLCQFMNSSVGGGNNDTSLLAMSTLLQTKCELHVEQRDPLPFTPVVVLEDDGSGSKKSLAKNKTPVQWATPVKGLTPQSSNRPFPKFHLEEEYEDEKSAQEGQRAVEFNRSLLINGFRRLEALERKRDFQAMSKAGTNGTEKNSAKSTTDKAETSMSTTVRAKMMLANPLEPSIMLSTLCSNQARRREDADRSHSDSVNNSNAASFLWEESGIGITCASLSPPDGRRVAIGCDDSAIRIWNLMDGNASGSNGANQTSVGDAGQVLLGHKNGFPVFDLSWNRDGRSLLSAGGDGSIRLWDTMAQGPFGEIIQSSSISGTTGPATGSVSSPAAKKSLMTNAMAKDKLTKATQRLEMAKSNPEMNVPGLRPESKSYTSGAALAVYRGHAPNTPIWSVAFSPSGYYFASGGSDATARLWTTDRPVPVRLFTGHTSNCVHSVVFHPNCNYVLSGGEDKTVRLWDIQTGQCVRLLNGCPAGIYKVDIDPSGQYAVGADVLGTVHVWDLATGKKVTELRSSRATSIPPQTYGRRKQNVDMIHSFAFSPCGKALATGGDDRTVRIWDIRKAIADPAPVLADPIKTFATRRTVVMDLQYTKRNLLLSIGKYISAI